MLKIKKLISFIKNLATFSLCRRYLNCRFESA